MNHFEIIILALALVFNSWSSYLEAGIVLAGEIRMRKIKYAGITFLLQFFMTGAGIWIGDKLGCRGEKIDSVISLSIMFIFGLKVLLSSVRQRSEEKTFDYTDQKSTFLSALAEGITPLFIGVAIGLLSVSPYFHWLLVGLFLLSGISIALILTAVVGPAILKPRFGTISGLLLLAAGIKLAINLTGF